MKFKCRKCNNMAVWYYAPHSSTKIEKNCYYCDEHIHRGCSCNIDLQTNVEDRDELGRLYPCIEYDYSENGFDCDGDGKRIY